MTIKNNKVVNQMVELKKPVSALYNGRICYYSINVVKVYVMRSGKPSHVIDDKGEKYDFGLIDGKDLIYNAIIRNLMFKELI